RDAFDDRLSGLRVERVEVVRECLPAELLEFSIDDAIANIGSRPARLEGVFMTGTGRGVIRHRDDVGPEIDAERDPRAASEPPRAADDEKETAIGSFVLRRGLADRPLDHLLGAAFDPKWVVIARVDDV